MAKTTKLTRTRGAGDATRAANAEALKRMFASTPYLVDVKPAGEAIAGLGERDLLHAGPPLEGWHEVRRVGALHGSILGALVHLGLAKDVAEAEAMGAAGAVTLKAANDYNAGGTYAGVIGRNTPVLVVDNRALGTRAVAAINEGRGKALRYGANDTATLDRLKWIEGEFAAVLGAAIRLTGGVDLYDILSQALHMGDDGHSRQKAASALLLNALAPAMVETGYPAATVAAALRFMAKNEIFFLPLAIGAGKSTMLALEGIAGATVVTCMAANGVRFGIKVAGAGRRWFTAPVPGVKGKYFEGFGAKDANPVIGDSEISETTGLGAFAMAAAPALARYVGGSVKESARLAVAMYRLALAEHPRFTIPTLEFRGTPAGIDVRRVLKTKLTPLFNTGIAHKTPGVGQIGAGFVRTPLACFKAAAAALAADEG